MPTEIRFGIIGLGLMGREFASAAAHWIHLSNLDVRPVLVVACDTNETAFEWFEANVPTINFTTTNYRTAKAEWRPAARGTTRPFSVKSNLPIRVTAFRSRFTPSGSRRANRTPGLFECSG